MNHPTDDAPHVTPEALGTEVSTIPVELSTRFLEHFSEQLYSSPQKAFEELISNGWDAGATVVDVRVDTELSRTDATMAVFDNGSSMDEAGLRDLWRIAFSPKEGRKSNNGRPFIGKFGIGKLATYVLAQRLTYICKAEDGVIRRVTMDYGKVDNTRQEGPDHLINNLKLSIFEVDEPQLQEALKTVAGGDEILRLIEGEPWETDDLDDDEYEEFGGLPTEVAPPKKETWTLVVLSQLKPTGRDLKLGILRRMLSAALPIGNEMCIRVNGERLRSAKLNAVISREWVIGPDLEVNYIDLDEADDTGSEKPAIGDDAQTTDDAKGGDVQRLEIQSGTDPYAYVVLPEVGRVTGRVRLYGDKISGGKSEERGASNGFHVNVLGRVVNQFDTSFGEENLNHAAWARFRMTVRVDGLNPFLTTNREQFKERHGMKVFRAFLRRVFNKARSEHDSDRNATMPDGGDVLVKSLGVVSLSPLRSIVAETLEGEAPIAGLFDETGIEDRNAKRQSWVDDTADDIRNALGQVRFETLDDGSLAKFRIRDSAVVVNRRHPFVLEHSGSKAEKELVRTLAMVGLLADVYALDIGIEPSLLESVRGYRDKLMRFRALQRRESGVHIAQLLHETQHDSSNWKRFEAAVGDALRYLGFDVLELGQPGEPEGVAQAFSIPSNNEATEDNPHPPLYSFSFDAKSSKHDVAKTGNISLDAVVEHRNAHKANHSLVVGPGFSDGSLVTRCREQKVTPMMASDLGKLLEYTAEFGAIPLTTLRELFEFFDPTHVSGWVAALRGRLESSQKLTIDVFIRALEELEGNVPDALAPSTIALICRTSLGAVAVKAADVISLVRGLTVIVPDLVGVGDDHSVVVNASPSRVANAIKSQLERLHREEDG